MRIVVSLLTAAHVVAGGTALVAGLAALVLPKAGLWHRRAGVTYFWAMAVVAGLAVVLAVLHPNLFVGLAAVFSFYFPLAGYRVWTRARSGRKDGTARDWSAILLLAAASAGFLVVWGRDAGPGPSGGPMALLFGLLGGAVAWHETLRLRGAEGGDASLRSAHAGLMASAYAATLLGFYAAFLPALWLWPVAVAAPYALVTAWSRLRHPAAG